jgi:hypothetical protein
MVDVNAAARELFCGRRAVFAGVKIPHKCAWQVSAVSAQCRRNIEPTAANLLRIDVPVTE